jgi:hypothetical protein
MSSYSASSSSYKKDYSKGGSVKKPAPKNIYEEDELYAAEGQKGWYMYHTTKDPENKFHQVRIGELVEAPEKGYRLEKIRYGESGQRVKYLLNKEALKNWIAEEYGFVFVDSPSPWAPKRMGQKTEKPAAVESKKRPHDDSDTEEDKPQTKKVATAAPIITQPEVTEMFADMKKKIDHMYILLSQFATDSRNLETTSTEEVEQS